MKMFVLVLFIQLLTACTGQAQPELIGGTPADPKDFPASVYASMGGAACSATIVGPRTLLIAAHCVENGRSANFTVGANKYTSVCTHAPQYDHEAWKRLRMALLTIDAPVLSLFAANSTADWTLCLVDREITGITYETLETREAPLAIGDEPLLSGYGCTRPGGSGGNDGVYRIGRAKVTELPHGDSNDTVTVGKAALCFGDSGGSFFCNKGPGVTERTLCGVNSRGNIKTTSYLSSTFTPMAKAFFIDWKTKNNQKLCGYDKDLAGCRGAGPIDPPPPPAGAEFTVAGKTLEVKGKLNDKAQYPAPRAEGIIRDAVRSIDAL